MLCVSLVLPSHRLRDQILLLLPVKSVRMWLLASMTAELVLNEWVLIMPWVRGPEVSLG